MNLGNLFAPFVFGPTLARSNGRTSRMFNFKFITRRAVEMTDRDSRGNRPFWSQMKVMTLAKWAKESEACVASVVHFPLTQPNKISFKSGPAWTRSRTKMKNPTELGRLSQLNSPAKNKIKIRELKIGLCDLSPLRIENVCR